jgi:hypothetical protein
MPHTRLLIPRPSNLKIGLIQNPFLSQTQMPRSLKSGTMRKTANGSGLQSTTLPAGKSPVVVNGSGKYRIWFFFVSTHRVLVSPKKANPAYKGKWYAPMIDNPDYKGPWSPRKIPNPDYFEDLTPVKSLKKIVSLMRVSGYLLLNS